LIAILTQQFAHALHVGSADEGNSITLFQISEHSFVEDLVPMVDDGVMATGKPQSF
jgi:hypothetical protein